MELFLLEPPAVLASVLAAVDGGGIGWLLPIKTILFLGAALCFVTGLKMLSKPTTARKGNMISALGMGLAVLGTLAEVFGDHADLVSPGVFIWMLAGLVVGAVIGAPAARLVKMTAMPEMVALFNGFGGIASLLIGASQIVLALSKHAGLPEGVEQGFTQTLGALGGGDGHFVAATVSLAILIGGVTFTGSLIAYGKLAEKITSKPVLYKGQNLVNAGVGVIALLGVILMAAAPGQTWVMWVLVVLALFLGVAVVIPIGGADMPVVIALLNSYSGLAACAAGFAIGSLLLIVTGALVGASGLILTRIMCVAMNRSLANVLFSGFGAAGGEVVAGKADQGEAKSMSPNEAAIVMEAARSVVFVPGYGMAVAQAQHAVRELAELLEANGADVRFAIHPVAGRMPGHMSVLLAEADVDYDLLAEPEDVNPAMEAIDVAMVIGANDVVNPDATDEPSSPLYGMPIIECHRARTCFVLKRSMRSGYAGVQNPLFFKDNTSMIFGDAKKTIESIVSEFKEDA